MIVIEKASVSTKGTYVGRNEDQLKQMFPL